MVALLFLLRSLPADVADVSAPASGLVLYGVLLVAVLVFQSCIATTFANAVPASGSAATAVAFAIYSLAPMAITASLARFANDATTPALCACCAAADCLSCFCLCASAFADASC